ncbi:MAG: glycosyltransferase [Endomicrobia bacterium]|nr:glycosyltransferase [Endomicrobiia bacterium]
MELTNLKVALVHDWLTGMRGGEKVLEAICEVFPNADLYTLVHIKGSVSKIIENRNIYISFIQNLPNVEKNYRYYLPLMPFAISQFSLSDYELVISSSHCVAKGVKVNDDAIHICYCHTPMRYIWDMYDLYFGKTSKASLFTKSIIKLLRRPLQNWDIKTAHNVNYFIANSNNVKERIKRIYSCESEVIYPPIDTDFFVPSTSNSTKTKDYYLVVSAFAPYKKVDIVIEAFKKSKYKLKIIGTGQQEKYLRYIAKGCNNIEFLGWQDNENLRFYYQNAKALIFPTEEDFGIVPVEAQACGTPVIAYRKGGALETVVDNETGVFFDKQDDIEIAKTIEKFEKIKFYEEKIRNQALKFSKERFIKEIKDFIGNVI